MNDFKNSFQAFRPVLMLTITQGLFALDTALLSVCSYVPYILMSIFAGALSDRWDKKKTCWRAMRWIGKSGSWTRNKCKRTVCGMCRPSFLTGFDGFAGLLVMALHVLERES